MKFNILHKQFNLKVNYIMKHNIFMHKVIYFKDIVVHKDFKELEIYY